MEPTIKELIQSEDEALDAYMAFALLWLAAAEGALNQESFDFLARHQEVLPSLSRADDLLAIIAADDMESFLEACRGLQQKLDPKDKPVFLKWAVATAGATGHVSIAANHTLRFIAELIDCGGDVLQAVCCEQLGHELAEPDDPSSLEWWLSREQQSEQEAMPELPDGPPVDRNEAFAILGLHSGAPRTAIKQAYRRLVQHHHPDRLTTLDKRQRSAAEEKFIRVQQAYELLRK